MRRARLRGVETAEDAFEVAGAAPRYLLPLQGVYGEEFRHRGAAASGEESHRREEAAREEILLEEVRVGAPREVYLQCPLKFGRALCSRSLAISKMPLPKPSRSSDRYDVSAFGTPQLPVSILLSKYCQTMTNILHKY